MKIIKMLLMLMLVVSLGACNSTMPAEESELDGATSDSVMETNEGIEGEAEEMEMDEDEMIEATGDEDMMPGDDQMPEEDMETGY